MALWRLLVFAWFVLWLYVVGCFALAVSFALADEWLWAALWAGMGAWVAAYTPTRNPWHFKPGVKKEH